MKLFITGTDTGVGKTYVATGLLKSFNRAGKSTIGIKPVATGCHTVKGRLYNQDALDLQLSSSIQLPYEQINPFVFAPAIAPHIAAQQINCEMNVTFLNQQVQRALSYPADVHIIEGFGGWLAPLNDHESMVEFVKANQLPVMLVVGMRLGCLNHAMLTLRAMEADQINIIGWIANCIDPDMEYLQENITTLQQRLSCPHLGIVKHGGSPETDIPIERFL